MDSRLSRPARAVAGRGGERSAGQRRMAERILAGRGWRDGRRPVAMIAVVPHWLGERLSERPDRLAFVHRDRAVTYGELIAQIDRWQPLLARHARSAGPVVGIRADHSPAACA